MRCEAPGHPGCAIDCLEDSCIAYYRSPSGPCVARCLSQQRGKVLPLHERFSIAINSVPAFELVMIFNPYLDDELKTQMRKSDLEINIELEDATVEELVGNLAAYFNFRDLPPSATL
jgi:hypothetical protein